MIWSAKCKRLVSSALPAAVAVAVAFAGGAVVASIPGDDGVIHACYNKVNGQARIIDESRDTCRVPEAPLSWSRSGPRGPAGADGPAGPTGPAGPAGAPGPGSRLETIRKADAAFATSSFEFVAVPGTRLTFDSASGPAVFWVSATEEPNCFANSQLAVSIDGTVLPLPVNNIHTDARGVGVLRIGQGGVTFAPLTEDTHVAELVLRRVDNICGDARLHASEAAPINFVILHS